MYRLAASDNGVDNFLHEGKKPENNEEYARGLRSFFWSCETLV